MDEELPDGVRAAASGGSGRPLGPTVAALAPGLGAAGYVALLTAHPAGGADTAAPGTVGP